MDVPSKPCFWFGKNNGQKCNYVIIMINKQNYVDLLLKTLKDFGLISSSRINWNCEVVVR